MTGKGWWRSYSEERGLRGEGPNVRGADEATLLCAPHNSYFIIAIVHTCMDVELVEVSSAPV